MVKTTQARKSSGVRILKPGNYPTAHLDLCGSGCPSNVFWENRFCQTGEEFHESFIDTSYMDKDEFENFEE